MIDRTPAVEALTWPARAEALVVQSADHYNAAAELLKSIKALRQKIADTFGPHVKRAFDAHRALVAEQKAAEAPLVTAETTIKAKLVAYDTEQEQIRREEARRLQELARQDEERRRLAEAAAMERQAQATGDTSLQAEAEALIAEPVEAPVITVQKATPVVGGISYRTTYSARVTDKLALIAYVAAHPAFAALLDPNMPALNAQARSLKLALQIPGIVVDAKRDIAAGAGR
ncbi:MAG: hypothetical protein NTY02_19460 [Acidobacteria bacterium]|nr:hypothetical protein [Acidobacteriota bacterium]